MSLKYSDRHRGRMIEQMVWGVPSFSNYQKLHVHILASETSVLVQAPALADFWQENFKVQVDARSGSLIHHAEEPPRKRRRMKSQRDSTSVPGEVQIEPSDGMDIDVTGGQALEFFFNSLELSDLLRRTALGSRPPRVKVGSYSFF